MMRNTNTFQLMSLTLLFFLVTGLSLTATPKFYDDDPLWKDPETQDASVATPFKIDLVYDLAENLFSRPGDKAANVRAQNINSVDEVPDSSWYTNRTALTAADVAIGPNKTDGPAEGKWTVIAAKTDGISPGFTVQDSQGRVWFIKVDPSGYPAMATGTEVTVTKLFWALGFNVPEDHIAHMRIENLVMGEGARIEPPSGKKRGMKTSDIKALLRDSQKDQDGSYRVHASLKLEGKMLGGYRLYGTRPDDPNDIVPHEHRRELRGYQVLAAWLNHVDVKALQSMDVLVQEDGKSLIRHYLLDFGSALGSGSVNPHLYWEGYEHILEQGGNILKDMVSFGLRVEPWRTQPFFKSDAVGRFPDENDQWDPDLWLSRAPNAAFLRARPDDRFWAARKLMAISDDMIRAAVKAGQFNDSRSEEFLVNALSQRRNAILKKYLPAVNPVVDPEMDSSGTLAFANAAVKAGVSAPPPGYAATWYRFNNVTGESEQIGETSGSSEKLSPPPELPKETGAFVRVEIRADKPEQASWSVPVHAYFRKTVDGWKLVGFERLP